MPFDRFRFLNDSDDDCSCGRVALRDRNDSPAGQSPMDAQPRSREHEEQDKDYLLVPSGSVDDIYSATVHCECPGFGRTYDETVTASDPYRIALLDAQVVRVGIAAWEYRRRVAFRDPAGNTTWEYFAAPLVERSPVVLSPPPRPQPRPPRPNPRPVRPNPTRPRR